MTLTRKISVACLAATVLATGAHAETFRWGASRDMSSLDPYSYGDSFNINVLSHVYEGLVRYDRNARIEPALATSWEIVSPTVWRFKLREGVAFHNGDPFTAQDVVASLERISHEESPLKGDLPAYKSSQAIDDHTVEIELTGTYPFLLNDLTNVLIFDAAWLKDNNAEAPTDIGKQIEGYATYNANGTGPFIVESRQPDAKTVFVKNAAWWDTPVHNFDRIELMPILSDATRVAALLSGEIDFTDKAPVQDLERLKASPDTRVLEGQDVRTVALGFNRRDTLVDGAPNPFNDLRVREAMQLAIDLDLIRDKIMRGRSRSTRLLVAPEMPGYDPELDVIVKQDMDKAKSLLAEAGFPEGFSFNFNCMSDGYVNEEQFCQAIAAMWTRVGLTPRLDIAPRAIQAPKRVSGQTDVYTLGWANLPLHDSFSLLDQVLHSKTGTSGTFNWGGWVNEELDRLTDAASVELDETKRLELTTAALKLARDEVIMIPLHQQPLAWAARADVEDVPLFSDNKPRLHLSRK